MHRKNAQRGATPLEVTATPMHQQPLVWYVTAGALLMVAILTLRAPPDDGPTASDPLLPEPDNAAPIVASVAIIEEPADPQPEQPQWLDLTVGEGDNLSLLFAEAGFTDTDLYRVAKSNERQSLRRIYPGERIGFRTDDQGGLLAMRHVQSPLVTTLYERTPEGYQATVITREPDHFTREVSMTIDSSLFLAGIEAGLGNAMIMELAGIFGGVIDFALDPRTGDTIHVIYEELMLDGEHLDDGPILAASFTNKGETFEAYRYTDIEGDTSYYNESGVSMRKAFLRAPLDFTRVSSNFNPNRLHPIYKTQRPHRGTDYAAPRGTPVYAAGDGRVIEAGYTRPNGNYIFIQHTEQFETHYLHLHRKRVKKGARVKQGQVIGTVGSTGAATGPHLHYEFLVNGVHRNPRTVHKILPKARSLPQEEIPRYLAAIQQPTQRLASLRDARQLARAE
ncbi:MAG: peptidoglycan DD-metalloendopeptidase family protein [Luminiphilus sp.]|jgi:murein DD-endopeptidase MepM/ murein hydrolase activator NlpD|nr:peptidoglycan DD-metalloendopeptidase family protein [Luminiphilus sp.]